MRIAVLSDIHGNRHAFEAVLDAVDAEGVDEVWCLGDVVGYGAQPDECAELVRDRCDLCLVGNHDLGVLGELDIDTFSPAAAAANRWTAEYAAPETLDWLRTLSPAQANRDPASYHASPRDPVWEYVLDVNQALECMEDQATRISLIGHSHVALYFHDGDLPDGAVAPDGTSLDVSENRWLLNPGSVGQPRDGDPRAAWLDLDTEAQRATWHRLPYDVDRAAESIREAGLPAQLAERLYIGQ